MDIKKGFGLLNDSILGHLFCVYLKLYKPANGYYYIIVNADNPLVTSVPKNLELMGLCNIKLTLGINTTELLHEYLMLVKMKSEQALVPYAYSNINLYTDSITKLKKLLSRYKVHETPINSDDLEKIREEEKIYRTLTYIISFNQDQHKKLGIFLKKYLKLYLQKELDGQQHHLLPSIYIEEVLNALNNPQYIQKCGYNNLLIKNGTSPFFCHSIMALVLQKKIRIRKMLITNQAVHVNLDNLTSPKKQDPVILTDELTPIEGVFICKDIILNTKTATLRYMSNKPINITLEYNPIKLLILLIENKGNVVEYPKIAQELRLPGSTDQYKGNTLGIKDIKSELRDILKKAGMSYKEFKKLIRVVTRSGYTIND